MHVPSKWTRDPSGAQAPGPQPYGARAYNSKRDGLVRLYVVPSRACFFHYVSLLFSYGRRVSLTYTLAILPGASSTIRCK